MPGPLHGLKVLEIASIGPGPFAVMMLADLGADVIRLQRAGGGGTGLDAGTWNLTTRGRPSVGVDLKKPEAVELALTLAGQADVLIEGFRPGVMERLGLGPDAVAAANPKLVYGRMTGYGQDGPLANVAGHDINYISVSGALGGSARAGERPLFPMNLLGDYGGGGMLLAFGVLAAVFEAQRSGQGQVVDAAMVEGVAVLSTLIHAMRNVGMWSDTPGTNILDSGAHWYEVYETADGKYLSVGALEPQFYARLLELLELDPAEYPQFDRDRWPELKERFAALFRTRTREEWTALLEGEETCVTGVLGLGEAASHPHNRARGVFVEHDGVTQPAPAPRFSRTPGELGLPPREIGADTDAALAAWGIGAEEIARLRAAGAVSSQASSHGK
ncbi:CaiB/BaiF CoA-transferase family protein [Conexibacter sp. DBS9H8]|uniref:CaiB/BaiF CoA transferase family protein n=1 Tax=Conexibacter sp. DBS9H8 TaxID=2937801 RepID=UPI00200E5C2E|nr:CaiB/BaiF CoA-transferase family protein [Conexibacter sp. DBS9H8]